MTEAVALIGGLASALAVVATSFRKRADVDIEELRTRESDLSTRLGDAEKRIGQLRAALVACEDRVFKLLRLLAANGINPNEEAQP